MKPIFTLFLLCSLLLMGASPLLAQDFDPDEAFYGGGATMTMGNRPFGVMPAEMLLIYVEESNDQDIYSRYTTFRKSSHSFSFKLTSWFELGNHVMLKVGGDFYGGQTNGASFEFGTGYNIGNGKFQVRPQTMLSYGAGATYLGDFINYNQAIVVNNKQFISDSVSVRLRTKHLVFTPQLEFAYEIVPFLDLIAIGGYTLPVFKGTPYLVFAGEGADYERLKAKEKLSEPNVGLYQDGEAITSSPVDLSNWFMQLGVGLRF